MPPNEVPPLTPGHVGWHELHATDWRSALAFYSEMFGWNRETALDLGAMGIYQMFGTGGPAVGGMMNMVEGDKAPHWEFVFNVEEIQAGIGRVKAGGGQIVHGPLQVPGGSWERSNTRGTPLSWRARPRPAP